MRIIGKYLGAIALTTLLMTSFTSANAQKCNKDGNKNHCTINNNKMCTKLNLTDSQTASFKAIKLKGDKQITPLKNKLNELHAKKRTLMSADKADKASIEKVIREMNSTRVKVQLIRTSQHLEMRKLLNDEQKVMWDKKNCNHNNKKEKRNGRKHKHNNKRERSHSNCCK